MRKLLVLGLIFALSGCGSAMDVCGARRDTYGLMDSDEGKADGVRYRPIIGNVVWGVLLFETVIGPIYFFGYSLFEPVGPAKEGCPK